MRKIIAAAALSATLMLGACQNPDGSVNMGNTLLLGAGVAALAGGVALAANSGHGSRNQGYYNRGYAPQYSSGYGYGRRGW